MHLKFKSFLLLFFKKEGLTLLALIAAGAAAPPARAQTFTTIDAPRGAGTELTGITNTGLISLYSGDGSQANPFQGFTAARPYQAFQPDDEPAALQSAVYGINLHGETAGAWANAPYLSPGESGFIRSGTAGNYTYITVNNPNQGSGGTALTGISNLGTAIGVYVDNNFLLQSFVYDVKTGSFTPFGVPGAVSTDLIGISDTNILCGMFQTQSGALLGFVTRLGSKKIVQVSGPNGAYLAGVNRAHIAVGGMQRQDGTVEGLVFNANTGKTLILNVPNATDTALNGINDRNEIVGFYVAANAVHGVLITGVTPP